MISGLGPKPLCFYALTFVGGAEKLCQSRPRRMAWARQTLKHFAWSQGEIALSKLAFMVCLIAVVSAWGMAQTADNPLQQPPTGQTRNTTGQQSGSGQTPFPLPQTRTGSPPTTNVCPGP